MNISNKRLILKGIVIVGILIVFGIRSKSIASWRVESLIMQSCHKAHVLIFKENSGMTTQMSLDLENRMQLINAFQDIDVSTLNDDPIALSLVDTFSIILIGKEGNTLLSIQLCNNSHAYLSLQGQNVTMGPYNKFIIMSYRGVSFIRNMRGIANSKSVRKE